MLPARYDDDDIYKSKVGDETIKGELGTTEEWNRRQVVKVYPKEKSKEEFTWAMLFMMAMMPLNHILRKFASGYKLLKSQEKINHIMYMNNIKLFAKNKKSNLKPSPRQ